jgi:hypothetical protein
MSKKKSKGGKAAAGGKAAKAEAAEAKKAKAPKPEKPAEPKISQAELDALRKPVEAAKGALEKAQAEAKALADKARALVAEAKDAYRAAIAPYREACHKAGVECEYLPAPRQVASRQAGEGGRSANVSEKVSFLVEKTEKGVRVMVKGQPKTEEVIPLAALKESINKAAYAYTGKWLGPKEEVGNKGGSLSNRIRAVLQA